MSRRVVSDRVKHADLVQHELVFLKYFRSREESWSSVVTWETSYNQQRNQKTSQFGPIRIRTFTALHNSVVERLPLRTETNNQKKDTLHNPPHLNYCHPTLCYWVQYSHFCSRLQGSSAYCFLYRTGQDAHALCSQSLGWEQSRDKAPTQ